MSGHMSPRDHTGRERAGADLGGAHRYSARASSAPRRLRARQRSAANRRRRPAPQRRPELRLPGERVQPSVLPAVGPTGPARHDGAAEGVGHRVLEGAGRRSSAVPRLFAVPGRRLERAAHNPQTECWPVAMLRIAIGFLFGLSMAGWVAAHPAAAHMIAAAEHVVGEVLLHVARELLG